MRILIADDEKDLLEMMKEHFESEGYEVETAQNGNVVIEKAKSFNPHLIILDLILPEKDGVESCIELRNMGLPENPMIIFLTSYKEDYSMIAGYEAGADDYIIKPIKLKILSLKIKALLQRYNNSGFSDKSNQLLQFGDLTIDHEKYSVVKNSNEIKLRKKEYDLLFLLSSNPGKVFNKEQIMSHIWGDDVIVSLRNIDVQVRRVREKIGENFIKTVIGVGYKFDFK